jgi:deoxyribonuclease V
MKLVVGVHKLDDGAIVCAVAFDEWDAAEASRTFTSRVAPVDPPVRSPRGAAELAGVLQLLREHALEPELIVIDGPVYLDAAETPAWGRQLFDALGGRSAVVGISTRAMPSLPAQFEVWRDEEARPLIVTCIGIDLGAAKVRVRTMHGRRRVPTLMKLAARLARGGAG